MIMLEPSEGGEICGGGIIDLFKKINIKKIQDKTSKWKAGLTLKFGSVSTAFFYPYFRSPRRVHYPSINHQGVHIMDHCPPPFTTPHSSSQEIYRPGTAISDASNLCTAVGGDQNK